MSCWPLCLETGELLLSLPVWGASSKHLQQADAGWWLEGAFRRTSENMCHAGGCSAPAKRERSERGKAQRSCLLTWTHCWKVWRCWAGYAYLNLRSGRLRLSYTRGSRSGWALWSCHKVKRTGKGERERKRKWKKEKRKREERKGKRETSRRWRFPRGINIQILLQWLFDIKSCVKFTCSTV